MPRLTTPRKQGGFTRVELLLVLVFALLGGGVLLVAAARASSAEARVHSRLNLHQLALGTINCSDVHDGKLPPGVANFYPGNQWAPQNGYGPCLFHILPFVEQDPLYKASLMIDG